MRTKEFLASCVGTSLGLFIGLLAQAQHWSAILLHLFTAYIIWQFHGLGFGLASLLFPLASEIYAFIRCWMSAGFFNLYSIAVVGVIALHVIPWLIIYFVSTKFNGGDEK